MRIAKHVGDVPGQTGILPSGSAEAPLSVLAGCSHQYDGMLVRIMFPSFIVGISDVHGRSVTDWLSLKEL